VSSGGTATSRGIAFQHAEAVLACVDALENGDVELLRVEGSDDIVDFELCGPDGLRLRVCQAKTRVEPYTWAPGEIVATIKRWQALADSDRAEFQFLTDGSAGKELVDDLLPALRRVREGALTAVDKAYLKKKDLDPADPVLARVAIESRQPDADALLDRVELRMIRLLAMGDTDATLERAGALVNQLYRLVSMRSGAPDVENRTITRTELADMIGVPLDVIDSSRLWDVDAQHAYMAELRKNPPDRSFVVLQAEEISLQPEALALVLRERPEAPGENPTPILASAVLESSPGAVLTGGPGAGKSTTLELLVPEALNRDRCPVLVSVAGYEANGLRRLVLSTLERLLEYRLAPSAIDSYLGMESAVLLLDGAGELEEEARESLIFELQVLQRQHPRLRLVLTARDPIRLRSLGLPCFVLQSMTPALRRTVADELLDEDADADEVVREVETRLGDVVANPLLFVMALSLARAGIQPHTRAGLFESFVEGMRARPRGDSLSDLVLALTREVCFELRSIGAYSVDQWQWRRLLADALTRLAKGNLFPAAAITADDALQAAQTGGLLRVVPSSGVIALTHDLFCDFLASEAVRLEQRILPIEISESLEELVVFLAERGSLTPEDQVAVSSNPVAAARCAEKGLAGGLNEREASRLLTALIAHMGEEGQRRLNSSHLRVVDLNEGR
jgi:hypothetical protein